MTEDKNVYGFKLTETARNKLKTLAEKNGLSMSQTVERMIRKWKEEDEL